MKLFIIITLLVVITVVVFFLMLFLIKSIPMWIGLKSMNENKACNAVHKISDQNTLAVISMQARCVKARYEAIKKIVSINDNPQAYLKGIEQVTDQEVLMQIAQTGKNYGICKYAIERITDPEKLSKVANIATLKEARIASVMAITDQELLKNIAFTNYYNVVRVVATERITDQDMLMEMAISTIQKYEPALTAVERIVDRDRLIQIALKCHFIGVMDAAFFKIDDKELLDEEFLKTIVSRGINSNASRKIVTIIKNQDYIFDVLKNPISDKDTKLAALDAITDQEKLFYIVNHVNGLFKLRFSEEVDIAIRAANRISDSNLIEDIALNNQFHCSIREEMIKRINNQAVLAKIAKDASDFHVRRFAADTIENKAVLAGLANESTDPDVRLTAVKKIEDQQILKQVYLHDSDIFVREEAMKKITDTDILTEFALSNQYGSSTQLLAIEKLSDLNVLTTIAKNDNDELVRCAAVRKIKDKKTLTDIALNDKSHDVKMCVFENLDKSANRFIVNALNGLRNDTLQKRRSYTEDLIRLLSKDAFASKLFWKEASRISAKAHTDKFSAHQDNGHSSNDCGHTDSSPRHQDMGIGITFPPYPFND